MLSGESRNQPATENKLKWISANAGNEFHFIFDAAQRLQGNDEMKNKVMNWIISAVAGNLLSFIQSNHSITFRSLIEFHYAACRMSQLIAEVSFSAGVSRTFIPLHQFNFGKWRMYEINQFLQSIPPSSFHFRNWWELNDFF